VKLIIICIYWRGEEWSSRSFTLSYIFMVWCLINYVQGRQLYPTLLHTKTANAYRRMGWYGLSHTGRSSILCRSIQSFI
jgi:hypothetical protein